MSLVCHILYNESLLSVSLSDCYFFLVVVEYRHSNWGGSWLWGLISVQVSLGQCGCVCFSRRCSGVAGRWAKQAASLHLVPLWTAGYVNEASCLFVTKSLVQAL